MSLVLHYPLNETDSSNIGTESISGTSNAINTNVISLEDPTYGPVADFHTNTSDLVIQNIPTLVGNSSRTFSAWVSYDNISKNTSVFSMESGGNWRWISGNYSTRFYDHINGNTSTYDLNLNNTTRTSNTWYHIVLTRDDTTSTHSLYVNGTESYTYTGTVGGTVTDLTIGRIKSINANDFDGQMLDLKIYDGVISPTEILDLYNSGPNAIVTSTGGTNDTSSTTIPKYQTDPPVNDAVVSLRIKDLDTLTDGNTVSSWGSANATSSPIYTNPSDNFPYVNLNNGYFTLGEQTIQPSLGFTYTGLVYTTTVGPQYPLVWSYAEAQNDGIRIYRTGGSGQDLVFRSQKAGNITATAEDETTINTWQVFTSRVTDNGDSTLTMEIFVDNVLKASTTAQSSDMSGIVSGLLEVGQSTAWGGNPVSSIYISDCFFYDRALSDVELLDMYNYFLSMNEQVVEDTAPPSVLNIVPGPVFVNISWPIVNNALSYKVEVDNGYITSTENLELFITDLIPETLYSFSVYYTLNGNDFILTETKTETTLENTVSNYNASDFLENNIYDFGDIDPQYLTNDIIESLVSNNSRMIVPVESEEITGTVLTNGGTIDIPDDAIISTVDSSGGSGEVGTITLSDSTSVSLEVLEDTSQVTVNGVTYNDGESFALDGKRAIVNFI